MRPRNPQLPPPWQDASAEELHLLIRDLGVNISSLGVTDVAVLRHVLQGTLAELQWLATYMVPHKLDPSTMSGCARSLRRGCKPATELVAT